MGAERSHARSKEQLRVNRNRINQLEVELQETIEKIQISGSNISAVKRLEGTAKKLQIEIETAFQKQKDIKTQLAENELRLEISTLEHSQYENLANHINEFDQDEKEYQENVAGYRKNLEQKNAENAILRIRKSHNDLLDRIAFEEEREK